MDVVTLLASRVDALAQRLEKVTSSPSPGGSSGSNAEVYAICETCGVQGHTFADCYNGPPAMEQVNAYQGYQPPPQHSSHPTAYNQGGKGYPNSPYTTHAPPPQHAMRPPGFQPRAPPYAPQPQPQPPSQHSTAQLESMMAQFLEGQTKTNEAVAASISQLTTKVDALTTHQKAMDHQLAQIAQQVSHLSRPQGQLPGQTETNPRGHVNAISTVRVGHEESPVMVLQETIAVPDSVGTEEQQSEGRLPPVEMEDTAPPSRPYHPRVPYPQRLAWAHLLQFEPKYARFLERLRRIYADTPFLEALKKAPSCLQFVRDFLAKKGEPEGGSVMPLGRVCSSLLQSSIKLQDPGDFCIPCCIGDVPIERALCDLGASVSLMPLSLYRQLELLELTPTTTLIQLADCSTRQPVGILEDVPVRVGEFVVPCDFYVVDMEESPHMPIILGRPFLATAGAEINVQAGTLSFCICGERVSFCFPPPMPTPAPTTSPPPPAPSPTLPPVPVTTIPPPLPTSFEAFDGDGGPDPWPPKYATSASIPTCYGISSALTGEVLDPTSPSYTFPGAPLESSLSTIWR